MPITQVRPLKLESPSTGGSQTDFTPTEVNPSSNYISARGIAFNGDPNYLVDFQGRTIAYLEPYTTMALSYTGAGDVSQIEYFNSNTQVTANRIYGTYLTYSPDFLPSVETTYIYDVDGSTILRTYTFNYTYTGFDLTSATASIT